MVFASTSSAQAQKDDLLEFITKAVNAPLTRAGDDYVEVDLSKFQATVRETTLPITGGKKFRFINGTLTKSEDLEGPIMSITEGSAVAIGNKCTIGGGTANDSPSILTNNGMLTLEAGGSLTSHGKISSNSGSWTITGENAVEMTNNADKFYAEGGHLSSPLLCTATDAHIELNTVDWHTFGTDFGTINTYSDVYTNGLLYSIGDVKYFWMHINLLGKDNVVYLKSSLVGPVQITGMQKRSGDAIVKGATDYQLTSNDLSKTTFIGYGSYTLTLNNNTIYLKENDDLQEYINNVPANGSATVNLRNFKDTTRLKTLYITDGRQITFTNGELNRDPTTSVPVLKVSNGGVAIVSDGALISGRDRDGDEVVQLEGGRLNIIGGIIEGSYGFPHTSLYMGGPVQYPALRITSPNDHFLLQSGAVMGTIVCDTTNADLQLIGGNITGVRYGSNEVISQPNNGKKKMPAYISFGPIVYSKSDVIVKSVKSYYYSNQVVIRLDGSSSSSFYPCNLNVTLYGSSVIKLQKSLTETQGLNITAPDKGDKDVLVEGSGYQLTGEDRDLVTLGYNPDDMYKVILKKKKNQLTLYYDDLPPKVDPNGGDGKGTEDDPYKDEVPCEGVNVKDDADFDDLYWFITGKQPDGEDCQGTVYEDDGDINIKKDATVTFDSLYFHGCGCSHYIHVYGTLVIEYNIYIVNYLRFIYVHSGGRVIIRGLNGEVTQEVIYIEGGTVEYHGGEVSGGTYGWYNVGGTIYIYGGTIKGNSAGGYTGGQGTTYIYGGTIYGGFVNYGTTYWYGGTVTGGTDYTVYNYKGGRLYIYGGTCTGPGTIWNEGDLYIDGSNKVSVQDIYLIKGCHVYVLSKLTYKLRLHITVDNIVLNTPIILGGNGYRLTKEDCSMLEIILPDGYTWHYDETAGGVVITSSTGINQITIDKTTIDSKVYSVDGNRRSVPAKGLNIIRYSDGTVRKVVVK